MTPRHDTPDDDYRDVNWKATVRRCRPISNVYQAQRSREVILCIDCGRMMGNPVGEATAPGPRGGRSHPAGRMLPTAREIAWTLLFRDVVHRVTKPASGMTAVRRIMDDLVDAKSEPVFPSYSALMSALCLHQNRRSLVLLFTDLNDPQLASNLAEVMPLISRKHLSVVISLSDSLLNRVADGEAADSLGYTA